jgi:predicted DsbA family dithiol-disulfide isomerase
LERQWYEAGISSVPAVIINEKYLISGGQPADAFERALRTIAAEA